MVNAVAPGPLEVANAVLSLASDEVSHITRPHPGGHRWLVTPSPRPCGRMAWRPNPRPTGDLSFFAGHAALRWTTKQHTLRLIARKYMGTWG